MRTRLLSLLLVPVVLALSACEPKFAKVTFTGVPTCPGSKLATEVVLKVDGPRVNSMTRFNGTSSDFSTPLQQGKEYELKTYKCSSEPCEAPANLVDTQKLTAPESDTGSIALTLKGFDCEPVAPPAPPAPPPAPEGATDAGADAAAAE